jgi:hypothetical protein
MTTGPNYTAAQKWLRQAKKDGRVTVLGGGWWRIDGLSRKPIQGFHALYQVLVRRGLVAPPPAAPVSQNETPKYFSIF